MRKRQNYFLVAILLIMTLVSCSEEHGLDKLPDIESGVLEFEIVLPELDTAGPWRIYAPTVNMDSVIATFSENKVEH